MSTRAWTIFAVVEIVGLVLISIGNREPVTSGHMLSAFGGAALLLPGSLLSLVLLNALKLNRGSGGDLMFNVLAIAINAACMLGVSALRGRANG